MKLGRMNAIAKKYLWMNIMCERYSIDVRKIEYAWCKFGFVRTYNAICIYWGKFFHSVWSEFYVYKSNKI